MAHVEWSGWIRRNKLHHHGLPVARVVTSPPFGSAKHLQQAFCLESRIETKIQEARTRDFGRAHANRVHLHSRNKRFGNVARFTAECFGERHRDICVPIAVTRIARAFQHDGHISRSTKGDCNTGNFGAQGVGLAHESPLLDDPPELPPPDELPPEPPLFELPLLELPLLELPLPELPLPELPLPELPLLELPLPELPLPELPLPAPDDAEAPVAEVDGVAGFALSLLESPLFSLLAAATDAALSLAPERWSFLPSLP